MLRFGLVLLGASAYLVFGSNFMVVEQSPILNRRRMQATKISAISSSKYRIWILGPSLKNSFANEHNKRSVHTPKTDQSRVDKINSRSVAEGAAYSSSHSFDNDMIESRCCRDLNGFNCFLRKLRTCGENAADESDEWIGIQGRRTRPFSILLEIRLFWGAATNWFADRPRTYVYIYYAILKQLL